MGRRPALFSYQLHSSAKMYKTSYNESEKLWSGRKVPLLYNGKISVAHGLLRAMKSSPRKLAQINAVNGAQIAHGEVCNKTIRVAQNIQKLNYEKNDIFAIIAKNSPDADSLFMGLLCAGHTFTVLHPSHGEIKLIQMLEIIKPKLVFTEPESLALVKKCLKKLRNGEQIINPVGFIDLFAETGIEGEFTPAEIDAEKDVAVILWSPGSSGLPNAISVTHSMLWNEVDRIIGPLNEPDQILFSYSHIGQMSGVIFLLAATLNSSTRVVTPQDFSPELLLKTIEKYRITVVSTAPSQLITVLKCDDISTRDLTSLRFYLTDGYRVSPHLHTEFRRLIPSSELIVEYSMTEAGKIASNYPFTGVNATGQLVPNVIAKIVDENGYRMVIGEIGEVCIKGPVPFAGHFGRAEKSAKRIDADGFIKTGDVGYFDRIGYLFLIDRKASYLAQCDALVRPLEVEEFLVSCAGIKLAYVTKVEDGHLVAVIIRTGNPSINEHDILDMVAKQFDAKLQMNGGVIFVDAMPFNESGKLMRSEMHIVAQYLYDSNKNNN